MRIQASAFALMLGAAMAGAPAEEPALRLHRSLSPLPPGARDQAPLFVASDGMQGFTDGESVLQGNAEIRRHGLRVRADQMRYWQDLNEVEASGNVEVWVGADRFRGPRLRMRIDDQIGALQQPEFSLGARPSRLRSGAAVELRGDAKVLRLDGEDRYRLDNARFTTCKPGVDDWYLSANSMDLDFNEDLGVARGARLTFKGVSTPTLPWVDFPLSGARKSGFLPPTIGAQGKVGAEVLVPYYWNIAPHADATLTPRYMTQRGLQILSEARYLDRFNNSAVRYEYLPNDQQLGTSRSAYSIANTLNIPGVGVGLLNLNRVSDDAYFRELSGRMTLATQAYLPREGSFQYAPSPWWSWTTRVQRFQTLQNPSNPVTPPYERVPQILLNGQRYDYGGFDLAGSGEFVSFEHPTLPTGQRLVGYPSISYPMLASGGYLRPKVGMHLTRYGVTRTQASEAQLNRAVPIFSVDSGLTFERPTKFRDADVVQTLEPRVYYLRVPYRNQNNLPVFDTGVTDFNYAQIFSENYYVGSDRVSDANQLTLALTSKLIRTVTGQEIFRALLAQRIYFEPQRVGIASTIPLRTERYSSYLFGLAGQVLPRTTLEATAQIDSQRFNPERFNIGARYQPARDQLLNVSYRYTNEALNVNPLPGSAAQGTPIRQIDGSVYWPITGGFSFIGRYNYSIANNAPIETLAGVEYNAGCWTVRGVTQRFITGTGEQNRLFFIQLELDGLSRVGSNPREALRRSVPGYSVGAPRSIAGQPFDLNE
ncbi:MAG: LPS-assembly protein LptD [Betaproteobacteria bacterium]|nr:LPS-assembly protein LptD [Betaproteobacteria bacterium]